MCCATLRLLDNQSKSTSAFPLSYQVHYDIHHYENINPDGKSFIHGTYKGTSKECRLFPSHGYWFKDKNQYRVSVIHRQRKGAHNEYTHDTHLPVQP